MTAPQWEEPPPPTASNGMPTRWAPRLEPLKARPGQWARVLDYMSRHSAYGVRRYLRGMRRHQPANVDPSEWEFAARRMPEDSEWWALWARYVGGGDA